MDGLSFYHWVALFIILLSLAVPVTLIGFVVWFANRQKRRD